MHYASTKSAAERRKTLKKWFNFVCKCRACSDDGYATGSRSAAGEDLLRSTVAGFKVKTEAISHCFGEGSYVGEGK